MTVTLSLMHLQISSNNNRRRRSSGFSQQQEKMMVKHQPMMRVRTASDDDSSTISNKQDEKQELVATEQSVFRRRMDAENDMEDCWTLKRANAVIDEDDDNESFGIYESPSKRQCQELSWNNCYSNDQNFQLNVSSSGEFFLG